MADELIEAVGDRIDSITLIRGFRGQFEVEVDGQEAFSKRAAGRHAEPGEVALIVESRIAAAKAREHLADHAG